ncbi:MFS transporter [Nitratireductor aquibiodomus]|uniref:MFS transporter n=1 Tax=Nitratireductor aquibiodomus TaxID=204799 RepID=UPI00351F5F8B
MEILVLFVISLVLLALFWGRQHKLAERGRSQLVPANLLQSPRFLSGLAKTTLLFSGLAGSVVILAIVLQTGLEHSPASAGLILAAHPLAAMAASLSTGRLGARHLQKRILFGFAALFLGMLLMQRLIALEAWPLVLWGPLTLIGAGAGTAIVALFQSILREVEASDAGAGSGALQALQQVGIALGIAILGQIYFSSLTQADAPQLHVSAFQNVLWLPIAIYAGLIAISLRAALKESSSDASFEAHKSPDRSRP